MEILSEIYLIFIILEVSKVELKDTPLQTVDGTLCKKRGKKFQYSAKRLRNSMKSSKLYMHENMDETLISRFPHPSVIVRLCIDGAYATIIRRLLLLRDGKKHMFHILPVSFYCLYCLEQDEQMPYTYCLLSQSRTFHNVTQTFYF